MFFQSQSSDGENRPRRRHGCLRGILIFFGIYFLTCAIMGVMMGNMFSTESTHLEPQTVYRLDLEGTLVEQAQEPNPFTALLKELPGYSDEESVVGLDELKSNIALAKTDDCILGICLMGGELQMAPASAKALRDALLDFKTSGKWIVAVSDHWTETNYYVASVADRICLEHTGAVDWHGLVAQKMYYTRLMEKLGIEMQILKVGSFKSAVEPFFRTSMSEADRLQTKRMLGGVWDEYVSAVSASRHISRSKLDRYADLYMGLQPAELAMQYGLVDTLMYRQDADKLLRTYCGTKDYHVQSTGKMSLVKRAESTSKDEVAVVYLEGEITDTDGDGIVGTEVVKLLKDLRKDDAVKAVVLRVNSPGGSADASEKIWHAVDLLRKEGKPVVVSMGDYAASGGYYISCGADYIFAEPTTITGSIGIFGTVPNVRKLREKIGLDVDAIGTHRHATLEADMVLNGMDKQETQLMQNMVERGYDLFTRRCADGRHTTQDSIKMVAEGRVWLGIDALDLGLIDQIGGLDDAIRKAVGLSALEQYRLAFYPEKVDPVEEILEALISNTPDDEERLLIKIKSFASRPRIMALMPEVKIE